MRVMLCLILGIICAFLVPSWCVVHAEDEYKPYTIDSPHGLITAIRNNAGLQLSFTKDTNDNYLEYFDIYKPLNIDCRGYVISGALSNSGRVRFLNMCYPENPDILLKHIYYYDSAMSEFGNWAYYVDKGSYLGDWRYCDGGADRYYKFYLYFLPASKGLKVTQTLSADKTYVTLTMTSPDQEYASYEYWKGYVDPQEEENISRNTAVEVNSVQGRTIKITKNGEYTIRASWKGSLNGWDNFPVSQTVNVTGIDSNGASLASPSNLKATIKSYNSIKLTWGKVSGAKKYYVYQKAGSGKYKNVKTVTSTSWTASNLKGGTGYTYYVVAVNSAGKAGAQSKTASATTVGKPSNVKVSKKSSTAVTVKWSKTAGASGYQISKSASAKKTEINSTVNKASTLSKNITAKAEKTYYYKVRAYKTVGSKKVYGPWSAVKSYKITKTGDSAQSTSKQPTNAKIDKNSSWYSRMQQFIKLNTYKNGASWGAKKRPVISSYGCYGCRAYAADFVAYVYGKKNSKSDKKQNKYNSYVDCTGGKINNITKILPGDVVCDKSDGGHVFVVIDIDWKTGKMLTAEGNVSGKKARVGNYYRVVKNKSGSWQLEERYGSKWKKQVFKFTRHYGNI